MSNTPDIDRLVSQLKSNIFVRWMRQSQKQAFVEWRDSTASPGLAARFTHGGDTYYGYEGMRRVHTGTVNTSGGILGHINPIYVKSGALRDSMKNRRPISKNGADDVVTSFNYGGGALNLLWQTYAVLDEIKTPTSTLVQVRAYSYSKPNGTTVHVTGYTAERHGYNTAKQYDAKSYAARFQDFSKDMPGLKARCDAIMRDKVMSAAWKDGKIRVQHFSGYATTAQLAFGED